MIIRHEKPGPKARAISSQRRTVCVKSMLSEQRELQDEREGQDVHKRADLFRVARDQVDQDVEDDSEHDAVRDAVEERHRKQGDIGGEGF